MTQATDSEVIKMYQRQLEMYALENARLEKINKDLAAQREKSESRVKELSQEYDRKFQQAEALIIELEQKNSAMLKELTFLRRRMWGKSSERFIPQDPNQRRIEFDGIELTPEEKKLYDDSVNTVAEYKEKRKNQVRKQASKPVRVELPDTLRREVIILPDPKEVNQQDWVNIGEKVTEVLSYKPAEIYVKQYIRKVWAKKGTGSMDANNAEENTPGVVISPYPDYLQKHSKADPSLIASLLVGKYVDHLPFYRQIEMFKRSGISLSASTVNDWFMNASDMMRAMYDRLKELVLKTDYIQVDESTVPVVDKEKSKTIKGYLWVVRSVMEKNLFFFYDQGSRAQKVAIGLLAGYQGTLQTDGYGCYSIFENINGVLLLNCWAHARRYYESALTEDKSIAEYALGQIALLYDIERMADEENLSFEQRAKLRTERAYPILRAFEVWNYKNLLEVADKSKGRVYKALHYSYSLFCRLSRYHLDGRYKMDNNLIENSIRPLAIGRKNYLFCQNNDAAENAAVMYSLLGCCKAHDVNPFDWLNYVLCMLPKYNSDYSLDLADLLPHNYKKNSENS